MSAPPHGLYGAPIAMPWQTILADLALILFMMTAAALANAPDGPILPKAVKPGPAAKTPPLHPPAPSPRGEPVAVWRNGPGAPDLGDWLAQQARDPRLRVSILVRHAVGQERAALGRAEALVAAAGKRGAGARIVIEPGGKDGSENGASVLLAYDAE
jgi:hypothetical protein